MIPRIFNQEKDFSCGVACVAILASLNTYSEHEPHCPCITFLFTKLTENQLEKPNINLKTNWTALLVSFMQGLRATRFKLNAQPVEQFKPAFQLSLSTSKHFFIGYQFLKFQMTFMLWTQRKKRNTRLAINSHIIAIIFI